MFEKAYQDDLMIKVEMDQIIEEILFVINIVYYWKDVIDCMIWSVFV